MSYENKEMNDVNSEQNLVDADEMKNFLITVLTDLTVTKNNIYNGKMFHAHSGVQKLSDRIKDKIGKL